MEQEYKISIIGDIMCELPLLRAVQKLGYSFEDAFAAIKPCFAESDFVIGNLETPLAGKDKGYTNDLYSFNTPDEIADAIIDLGIDSVSLANNHCLDRSRDGLLRTMKTLEDKGLDYFGVAKSFSDRLPYYQICLDNLKVGIIGYTYNTNVAETGLVLREDEDYLLNILQSQEKHYQRWKKNISRPGIRYRVSGTLRTFFNDYQIAKIKRALGIYHNAPYVDKLEQTFPLEDGINRLEMDIKLARKNNDFVFVYLHSGGQFSTEIGSFTKMIVDKIEKAGADGVIGHHPHVVQEYETSEDFFTCYSLGNFSLSPSSIYVIPDNLPEYGLILHLYLNQEQKRITRKTITIIKMVDDSEGKLRVVPTNYLFEKIPDKDGEQLKKDCIKILSIVKTDDELFSFQEEYELP